METKEQLIDRLLDLAFAEDIGDGDHTTLSTIPATATGRQHLLVKEDGIIAGVEIAGKVFNRLDPALKMEVLIADGTPVRKGDVAFVVEGPVRSLLIAERTMLNIMQRMSGIATTTARYQKCHGTIPGRTRRSRLQSARYPQDNTGHENARERSGTHRRRL